MFLKNKNIIFKIRRSKVTDYAALTIKKSRTPSEKLSGSAHDTFSAMQERFLLKDTT